MAWQRQKTKYNNKKTRGPGGMWFDSRGEKRCYEWLKAREQAGEIEILRTQENIHLSKACILYKPDFTIRDKTTDQVIYIEYKGFQTAVWRIKRRLWKHYGPGPLEIYKGNMILVETIIPKV